MRTLFILTLTLMVAINLHAEEQQIEVMLFGQKYLMTQSEYDQGLAFGNVMYALSVKYGNDWGNTQEGKDVGLNLIQSHSQQETKNILAVALSKIVQLTMINAFKTKFNSSSK